MFKNSVDLDQVYNNKLYIDQLCLKYYTVAQPKKI